MIRRMVGTPTLVMEPRRCSSCAAPRSVAIHSLQIQAPAAWSHSQLRRFRPGTSWFSNIETVHQKSRVTTRCADGVTLTFKDAVSIIEIYRKKHPELDQYIPAIASTQRQIEVRNASSEDSHSYYRFHIDVVDGDPRYGVTLDQEEPSYLDRSEWQKQFHVRLAKTIATIIVKRGSEK